MEGVSLRVLVAGATGTIGQATVRALLRQGHTVVCILRPQSPQSLAQWAQRLDGAQLRQADVSSLQSLQHDAVRGEQFDAVVSCMASRSGVPADAWAIDHQAQCNVLQAAQGCGVKQFVLLSAICVQKPLLTFQRAKLAFERELMASAVQWSIVRPTAFFKSLSGQIQRVRQGKPFLVFGDGALTACKPISDDDLGDYMAGCLRDPACHNRVLPIGGPGPAITPLQQGQMLFDAVGKPARYKQVPVALLDVIVAVLSVLGRVVPALAAKAELARIGRYYATESMLVWDAAASRYDADATPSTGTQTLGQHYAAVLRGDAQVTLGDHAVFGKDGGRYRD